MSTLRLVVALIVTLVWAAAWIAAILTGDYEGVGGVTPVMLGIVGFLFAPEWMKVMRGNNGRKNGGDNGRDNGKDAR